MSHQVRPVASTSGPTRIHLVGYGCSIKDTMRSLDATNSSLLWPLFLRVASADPSMVCRLCLAKVKRHTKGPR